MTPGRKIVIAGVAIVLLVLMMSTFFGKKGLLEIRQARRHQQELAAEIKRLKEKKANLEKEIEELKKNPAAVEEEARKKLWLMKPKEKVLVLPPLKKKDHQPTGN